MPFPTYAHPMPAFAFLTLKVIFEAILNLTLYKASRVACLDKRGGRHRLG